MNSTGSERGVVCVGHDPTYRADYLELYSCKLMLENFSCGVEVQINSSNMKPHYQ